jgi:Ni/Co efflux regulator RcnB
MDGTGVAVRCKADPKPTEAVMKKAGILAATMLGATLMAAGPALADPPHCPPGHAKKGWCSSDGWDRGRDRERDRDRDRRRWDSERDRDREDRWRLEEARERAYEDGYRDAMRDAWQVGERIPYDRYRAVPDYYEYGWPAPRSGSGYVYADDRYYLVEMATGLILDVLTQR